MTEPPEVIQARIEGETKARARMRVTAQRIWVAVWLLVACSVALALLTVFVWRIADDVSNKVASLDRAVQTAIAETRVNREAGFKNRALNCQALLALGQLLPETCLDPAVTAYYDPNAKPQITSSSVAEDNARRLCALEEKVGIEDKTCPATG